MYVATISSVPTGRFEVTSCAVWPEVTGAVPSRLVFLPWIRLKVTDPRAWPCTVAVSVSAEPKDDDVGEAARSSRTGVVTTIVLDAEEASWVGSPE